MARQVLLFLPLLLCLQTFGQQYYPFPTDSATWSVQNYHHAWMPNSDECYTEHYGLDGDTTIGAYTYGKLYGNNIHEQNSYPYLDSTFNRTTAEYVAAVREDSQKKVWLRFPEDTADVLYYDFSLSVGDTFQFDYFEAGPILVTEVDSILVGGDYRRVLRFYEEGPGLWIEGIGSNMGWFEWGGPGTFSWQLLCFSQNGTQLFGYETCNCNTYTDVPNLDNTPSLVVYPNPATSCIRLESNTPLHQVWLTDIAGKRLMPLQQNNDLWQADVSALPNGIYLVETMSEQKIRAVIKVVRSSN